MHEQKIMVRYFAELGGALALYTAVLVFSLRVGPGLPAGAVRTLVLISPMLPSLLAVWAIVRQVRRIDEYGRMLTLESLAIAAAVTAAWTFTYGFMENAGFPRLSMFTVWEVMGPVWGLVAMVRGLCFRR